MDALVELEPLHFISIPIFVELHCWCPRAEVCFVALRIPVIVFVFLFVTSDGVATVLVASVAIGVGVGIGGGLVGELLHPFR